MAFSLSTKQTVCFCVTVACCAPRCLVGQEQPPPLDGTKVAFADQLLNNMVGNWKVAGTIRGHNVVQTVEAATGINSSFCGSMEPIPQVPGPLRGDCDDRI